MLSSSDAVLKHRCLGSTNWARFELSLFSGNLLRQHVKSDYVGRQALLLAQLD